MVQSDKPIILKLRCYRASLTHYTARPSQGWIYEVLHQTKDMGKHSYHTHRAASYLRNKSVGIADFIPA